MALGFHALAGLALAAVAVAAAAEGVSYRKMADMLYLVISSDRAVYAQKVVQRLTLDAEVTTASEHFEDDGGLPLPSQMLLFGAQRVADQTEDFSYSLPHRWRSGGRGSILPKRILFGTCPPFGGYWACSRLRGGNRSETSMKVKSVSNAGPS